MSNSHFGKFLDNKPSNVVESHPEDKAVTVQDLHEAIEQKWEERVKRETKTDRSVRVTFLMDKDLKIRLDEIADRKKAQSNKMGFKTMALNAMIRRCLHEYERDM